MRQIEKQVSKDKESATYQRLTWDALKKSINGLVNKVSSLNIVNIIPELFQENIVRGKGLLCQSLMKSQRSSPNFSNVYCALIAVVNTKIPEIGELICTRLIAQWKKAYLRNQKTLLITTTTFIAHMINQLVCDEMVALRILALLLEKPTDDSVEVAVNFVKEAGVSLQKLAPKPFSGVFTVFRAILHEGKIDKRVQYLIEDLFLIRQKRFEDFPAVIEELDLVEEEDQITHDSISLDDEFGDEELQTSLNLFHVDPDYTQHEEDYDSIRKEILGDSDSSSGSSDDSSDSSDSSDSDDEGQAPTSGGTMKIEDATDMDVTHFKRTIYLTIMSSLDFEECAHKLLKSGVSDEMQPELVKMIIECCAQERSYRRFYGLLGQRFAMLKPTYRDLFAHLAFPEQYESCHLYETNKLRNVATFFAHLLHTDAIPWTVFQYLRLNERDTNSSKRIFIKILFTDIAEYLGIEKLKARLEDEDMSIYFQYLFPRSNPKDTRFSINYFTSIQLIHAKNRDSGNTELVYLLGTKSIRL
eukprot:TRINITY_DN1689_c1_g2_i4.p1 TRINITY_DN1689_c1_g2~~TRINITY_DN1689_c1_g2_i4.p1  ORF type:complete len:559 (+),score=138.78 TRINITY_DN1689_c1_g2_i4:94-1677(+)